MCDDCSDTSTDTSCDTSDTTVDTSSDTTCDTSDTTSELPEDSGDLSDDGSEDLPEDDYQTEDVDMSEGDEELCDTESEADEVSDDGSEALPDESVDEVPDDGSEALPDDNVDEVPDDGSEALPDESVDEVPDDGSEALPDESVDEVPGDGSEALPDENVNEVPDDGSEALPDDNADGMNNDSKDNVSDISSDDLLKNSDTAEKMTNAPNDLPYNSVADYYNKHGYGQEDYATYSKDPEWRQLMREEYPDVKLPPYDNFAEYYGAHNFGAEDYNVYSRDPDWQELMGWDTSREAQELRDMGISNVDLRKCNPEYRGEIVDAVSDMYTQYPELKDQVRSIECYEMSNPNTYASYGPTDRSEAFGGKLSLNSTFFEQSGLNEKLKQDSTDGWLVPNGTVNGTISHELGHGLHLDMCSKNNNLEYGKVPDSDSYNRAVREYIDDAHAKDIVEQACRDCGLQFYSRETSQQLSRYGSSNYGEAFAEGISEANNSPNPRPFARAINDRYTQYKNNL